MSHVAFFSIKVQKVLFGGFTKSAVSFFRAVSKKKEKMIQKVLFGGFVLFETETNVCVIT